MGFWELHSIYLMCDFLMHSSMKCLGLPSSIFVLWDCPKNKKISDGFEVAPALVYTRLELQQLTPQRCSVYEHLPCLTLAQLSAEVLPQLIWFGARMGQFYLSDPFKSLLLLFKPLLMFLL